jgi:two-component system response regulator DctR
MELISRGLPNKLIADNLSLSIRTVEIHRARVFDKLGVHSAVELVNALHALRTPQS